MTDATMTFKEGLAHLQARVVVQKYQKTNRNRLRWTKGDIAAAEAILAGVALAVRKSEARNHQAPADDFSERERGSALRRSM